MPVSVPGELCASMFSSNLYIRIACPTFDSITYIDNLKLFCTGDLRRPMTYGLWLIVFESSRPTDMNGALESGNTLSV